MKFLSLEYKGELVCETENCFYGKLSTFFFVAQDSSNIRKSVDSQRNAHVQFSPPALRITELGAARYRVLNIKHVSNA